MAHVRNKAGIGFFPAFLYLRKSKGGKRRHGVPLGAGKTFVVYLESPAYIPHIIDLSRISKFDCYMTNTRKFLR
jgi:hypothetical protein